MPRTFKIADQEVKDLVNQLLSEYYQEFSAIGVRIDFLFAYGPKDEEDKLVGTAITVGGYPANGQCRILGLLDRTVGRGDAEIILDGDSWPKLETECKKALIDHELFHIVIKRNSDGDVMKDSLDRPRLKLRKHDRQFGWFEVIAKRHGEASAEVEQAHQLVEQAGQVFFPFIVKSLPKQRKVKTLKVETPE